MKTLAVLITLMMTVHVTSGQILGRIVDRAVDKVADRAEDKLVEAASEAIARQLYKPVDRTLDSMLYRSYRANGGADSIDYSGFLSGLDASERLPASYSFDVVMDVEVTDGKDRNQMVMLMTKTGNYFGMEQPDEEGSPIIVIDSENDLIAMYQLNDGEWTVSAMPNMISQYAGAAAAAAEAENVDYVFEKTGKTKKILGYLCDEYRFESEEEKGKAYAARDFPVTWSDTFGQMLGEVRAKQFAQADEAITGMILRSETKAKKGKKKTKWEAVKVNVDGHTMDNGDYKVVSLANQE